MIKTDHAHLYVAAFSHKGMKEGKINEDRYGISSYQFSEADSTPVLFAIVADGIGGHLAGEVAAEMVVNHISQTVAESNGDAPLETIAIAVDAANEAVVQLAADDEKKQGMGATCVCAWMVDNRLYAGYVGDSRLYLMRGATIQQLSNDHTWIQEALDKGVITPEQARTHPNQHVIRRYIGSSPAPDVDFRLRMASDQSDEAMLNHQGMPLQPGDTLLLCSDGLTDLVWNDEILEIVRSHKDLRAAAQALIALANERGGHDNITVVLLGVPENFRKPPSKKLPLGWLIAGAVALLAILGFGIAFLWYFLHPVVNPTPTMSVPIVQPSETLILPTETPLPTVTLAPTLTPTPRPTLGPTYTPWPTNTPEE